MNKVSLNISCMKNLRPRRFIGLLLAALLAGCRAAHNIPPQVQDFGPTYHPSNVYRSSSWLPVEVRRVAVLPLTTTITSAPFLEAGVDTLEPLVYAELEKAKRFEVIPVTPKQMKEWTGANGVRADEVLPHDLFKRIGAATACDAILFCQLTRYQPYPPLAVGWKFSLIENPKVIATGVQVQPEIIWSVDEVLDAGDQSVATGARVYYSQHLHNEAPSADPATMLSSPTRFGQYTLAALLATLPEPAAAKH